MGLVSSAEPFRILVRESIRPFCFYLGLIDILVISHVASIFKAAATDMRYFARSKFSRSLVHKKNFSLIGEVLFRSG